MPKATLPTLKNPAHSHIIISLSLKPMNNYELSKEFIDKDQTTIFRHMQNLKKEKWINEQNEVNFNKLTAEFKTYCYSDGLFSNININDLNFEINEVMKVLFEIAVTDNWKEKLGKKLTIEYIFNIIKQDIFIDYIKQTNKEVF
jgi:hypothetical protein